MLVDRLSVKSQIKHKNRSIYYQHQRDNKINILVLANQSDESVISALFHDNAVI